MMLAVLPLASTLAGEPFSARLIPPCAELAAAARTNGIPLDQLDPPDDRHTLDTGDTLTALVTLREKNQRRTQWILYLEVVGPPTNQPAGKTNRPMVLYSCAGTKLEFQSSYKLVELRTLGPFVITGAKVKPPKTALTKTSLTLDEGFLSLGLDRAAAAGLRIRDLKSEGRFSFRGAPFTDAEIERGRSIADAVHLTPEEERALAASFPALLSYFQVVQQTPDLENIMLRIVDRPSIWSMLRRGGVTPSIAFQRKRFAILGREQWHLPGKATVYQLPFSLELNEHAALEVNLAVTAPQPPLLSCGGIVALLAHRPGDEENYLMIHVLSARRATK
jgi:hypothetical protein